MRFPTGNHLLRIELITPANFGSADGPTSVDRPVGADPWSALPSIPESILKGVIAGAAYGNPSNNEQPNKKRDEVFGSADDTGSNFTPGRSAVVTFGDAEVLCFPITGRRGATCMIFPMCTLHRLASAPLSKPLVLQTSDLPAKECMGDVDADDLPAAVNVSVYGTVTGADLRALANLHSDMAVLIAGDEIAAHLWQQALETRQLTKVDSDSMRVAAGSLRKVELVPAATVFVTLVTSNKPVESDLPSQIQIGAWEATGHGFVALDWVGEVPSSETTFEQQRTTEKLADQAALMARAYKAISACASRPFAPQTRTLLREFGTRWRMRGLPATLAFALGKAKPQVAYENASAAPAEVMANRFLLNTLLGLRATPLHDAQATLFDSATNIIVGESEPPFNLDAWLLWLNRYAETLLGESLVSKEHTDDN